MLEDIVNQYNNTVHRTIKMKTITVTDDSFAEYNEDSNKRNSKFKAGDHVRISKYKNIFAKGYAPNWTEEIFVIKKVKNTVPWTKNTVKILMILMVKKLLEVSMKRNCKKLIKKNLE